MSELAPWEAKDAPRRQPRATAEAPAAASPVFFAARINPLTWMGAGAAAGFVLTSVAAVALVLGTYGGTTAAASVVGTKTEVVVADAVKVAEAREKLERAFSNFHVRIKDSWHRLDNVRDGTLVNTQLIGSPEFLEGAWYSLGDYQFVKGGPAPKCAGMKFEAMGNSKGSPRVALVVDDLAAGKYHFDPP